MASKSIDLSALSIALSESNIQNSLEALPRETIHNLQYQHGWTDIRLHRIAPNANPPVLDLTNVTTSTLPPKPDLKYILSGRPPRLIYTHPDLLSQLIKHNLKENDLQVPREWVLPMSLGETWTLKSLSLVFDNLPARDRIGGSYFQHQDAKRVLCGMKSADGNGGDGTIVYYIMHEGEVKPRQN